MSDAANSLQNMGQGSQDSIEYPDFKDALIPVSEQITSKEIPDLPKWIGALELELMEGYCGPVILTIALKYAGYDVSQQKVAEDLGYVNWWGTFNDACYAYLSQYFEEYGKKSNCTIDDIKQHLSEGHIVIPDWYYDDGHYSIVAGISEDDKTLYLVDGSRDENGKYFGAFFSIPSEEFLGKWYDFEDARGKNRLERWMMWFDPSKTSFQSAYPAS